MSAPSVSHSRHQAQLRQQQWLNKQRAPKQQQQQKFTRQHQPPMQPQSQQQRQQAPPSNTRRKEPGDRPTPRDQEELLEQVQHLQAQRNELIASAELLTVNQRQLQRRLGEYQKAEGYWQLNPEDLLKMSQQQQHAQGAWEPEEQEEEEEELATAYQTVTQDDYAAELLRLTGLMSQLASREYTAQGKPVAGVAALSYALQESQQQLAAQHQRVNLLELANTKLQVWRCKKLQAGYREGDVSSSSSHPLAVLSPYEFFSHVFLVVIGVELDRTGE